MLKKYRVTGDAGIMPKNKIVVPGKDFVLDDADPRLPSWLAEGAVTEIGVPTPKATKAKPNTKARRKTGTKTKKTAPKAPPKTEEPKVEEPKAEEPVAPATPTPATNEGEGA